MTDLTTLGWDAEREQQFEPLATDGLVPGRVAVQHRGAYDVLTDDGELRCELPRRSVREAAVLADLPVVGDWVAVAQLGDGRGTIRAVLPRRSKFSRRHAGEKTVEQVLVANVDVVFIVTSMNDELNLRRLERYLTLAWDSGAQPVILLTKADLVDDPAPAVADVKSIAVGVPVHAVSVRTDTGLDPIRRHLRPGVTAALLGSSGVGKSTLVNALAGEELLATREIRADGRGRHTTTRRQLVQLPGGGVVVDTPGLRELQLWVAEDGLVDAFGDVTSLFEGCRFSDCAHESEPGCAVRAALEEGRLAPERWDSYVKLQRELAALERRLDKQAAAAERNRWRQVNRQLGDHYRTRGER